MLVSLVTTDKKPVQFEHLTIFGVSGQLEELIAKIT